jgi:hypothetical protein
MRQALNKEEQVAQKRERVPVHEQRDIMGVDGLDHDKFVYRWVMQDKPDWVAVLLKAGYSFVEKGGSVVGDETIKSANGVESIITVAAGGGRGRKALMCIPREWWQSDQDKKQREQVDALEADMYKQLKDQADPRKGGYGSVDEFGRLTTARGQTYLRTPPKTY